LGNTIRNPRTREKSNARRYLKARLLFTLALATLAFSLHTADAAAQSFLSINDVTMNEGDGGTIPFTFTVVLSNPPPGNFTIMVDYATGGGTATPGSCMGGADYIPTSGSLTFNRNNLTRMVTVQVCGDTVFEPNETFLVNLFSERPPPIIVIKRQGIGTIVNDDVAPLRPTRTDVSCGALTVGVAATCTATVSDIGAGTKTTPTGAVTWSSTAGGIFVPNPCVLSPTATIGVASCSVSYTPSSAGSAQITANYGGDLTHEGSEGRATIQVAKRPTQTSVSCEDGSFEAGGSTNCTATVSDTGGGTKTTPTGTVDWSSDAAGAFAPDPCVLTPTATVGVASCTVVFSSTTAATHTITATYGGDPIHEGSTGSTTVTVTPGPPASVTLDPLVAQNRVDSQHCVTATVADQFGNRTPGIRVVFTVTGSNSTSGSRTTDANGQAQFCYTGRLFGVDTIDAFADTDNDGTRDLGEPSAVPPATKTWLLPPSTPLCEVEFPTGGGHFVADNGDRASFGGNAHVSSTGDPSGQQEYRDHGPAQPLNVHSISVLAVVCVRFPDGHAEATVFGEATIDGSGEYAYRIDVEDRGEPGTNDTYWITLSNGYNSGRHTLEGGNITIH
jgi:hypothetical protein